MDQSIQRHYDVLQSNRSQCPRVPIQWFHSGDTLTAAKECQWQRCGWKRLDRSEAAFEKGEVVQRRGDSVGGGLLLLLQATEVSSKEQLYFMLILRDQTIQTTFFYRDLFKWHHEMRRHFFQRKPCCLFSLWHMDLKTPLMFVKSIDDCDKFPWSFLWQWPFWYREIKTSFSGSMSLFVSSSNSINSLSDGSSVSVPVNSRLCISPVCLFFPDYFPNTSII